MADTIKAICEVETVRFFNPDSSWGIQIVTVVEVKKGKSIIHRGDLITVKGNMAPTQVGERIEIIAERVVDPKWGEQYNASAIYSAIPFGENDSEARRKYLASLFTEKQLIALYDALDDPFTALKEGDTAALVKVKGCGMVTADNWIRRFQTKLYMAKIFVELEEYHLTNNIIMKLIDTYGSPDLAVAKVKKNPYILVHEVSGIGWKTADDIALNGGLGIYSPERIGGFILYYLQSCGETGASWISTDELLNSILDNLGEDVPDKAITEAIHHEDVEPYLWWDDEHTKIGLKKYYELEDRIATELIRLRDARSHIVTSNWEDAIHKREQKQGFEFTTEQLNGVKTGLKNNITIITGSGGTGKTSLVSGIIDVLKDYTFVQCALSGRASARMSEVTGSTGYTIHRLLGFDGHTYTYTADNKMPYDIYIVDEISMINSELFYHLLRAIPDGAKVYLLGDPGQLESIGAGNVAHDMINSHEIPTVILTQIHRQAAKSAIVTESVKVRSGIQLVDKDWVGTETRGELQDLTIDCYSDASNTFYKIMEAFTKAMHRPDFDLMQEQVIVPVKNRGAANTYELNNTIQELINPKSRKKKEHTGYANGKPYVLREGDKVMNTVNNYKVHPNIYNGNIGLIKEFTTNDDGDEIMIVDFVGIGTVHIPREFWSQIELGYAITVHKFQGSEADHIIFGLDFASYSLLTREQVYTGITRAKKKCELIAQTGALRMAVGNQALSQKQTFLSQLIYEHAHPPLVF